MAILEELKLKANGAADQANNIQEAISMMEFDGGGSGSGVLIVGGITLGDSGIEGTLDKTWQEIHDAMQSKICIAIIANDYGIAHNLIANADHEYDEYVVCLMSFQDGAITQFTTSTANGYPSTYPSTDGGKLTIIGNSMCTCFRILRVEHPC